MLNPEERYCVRIFHGMLDQREMYDPTFDENVDKSDNVENFKFDPTRTEDVEIFNLAFLDRVAKIWQDSDDYFHHDPLLIDWFDSYSSLVFQFHMIELYQPNIKEILGEEYNDMGLDFIMQTVKDSYSIIISYHDPLYKRSENDIREDIENYDRLSTNMQQFGWHFGLPF